MPSNSVFLNRFISCSGAALAVASFVTPAVAASPFAGFAGNWTGSGTIQTSAGTEEIRCKARYTPARDGSTLNINVNCASDSYRVNIVSDVVVQGDGFSGSWQETTRQISGDVSGRFPEPGAFQASLQALGGGIQLGARTNGRRQAITIRLQGSEIQGASLTLKRV